MPTQNDTSRTGPVCEGCGTPIAPVIYGYPSHELMEKAQRGEVRLGGCVVPFGIERRLNDSFCGSCMWERIFGVHDLEDFETAHLHGVGYGKPFSTARDELAGGLKRSDWIWYVFPQILMGSSEMSRRFAIHDRQTVIAFLDHPTLGANYREALGLVARHVLDERGDLSAWEALVRLMGKRVDAKKFVSSITLFGEIARIDGRHLDITEQFDRFLAAGLRACSSTLDAIVRGDV